MTATLVARLSGPIQSYGEQSRFGSRGSAPYPTYSALLGIARAALGEGRGQQAELDRLRHLTMAVRIDAPGQTMVDYHIVSAPRAGDYRRLSTADRTQLGHTVPTGAGKPWRIEGRAESLQTYRTYLAEAAFLWLAEGAQDEIQRLREALAGPHWQLSLGRKSCIPDWPLALGWTAGPLIDVAARVPIVVPNDNPNGGDQAAVTRRLHLLDDEAGDQTIALADAPVGPHPHDGYLPRRRTLSTVTAPTVADRRALLAWARQELT